MLRRSVQNSIILIMIGFLTVINAPGVYSQKLDLIDILSIKSPSPSTLLLQAQAPEKTDEKTKTDSTESQSETEAENEIEEAEVLVDGEAIFTIQTTLGEITPEVRAKDIQTKIIIKLHVFVKNIFQVYVFCLNKDKRVDIEAT